MHELFKEIKYVGFDLDNTLYPKNNKIDNMIRERFATKVLEKRPNLKNIEEAIKFSEEEYKRVGSRTQILKDMGYDDALEIMQYSLEGPEVLNILKRDFKLVSLLGKIKCKYDLFLITASPKDLAFKKLNKIGIDVKLFNISIFGDTITDGKKLDGSIFKYFLDQSLYSPEQHVYVGDSLKADIIPAKSLRMNTIAVGSYISEADYSIKRIYDLESILL
jgi:putative hydrolase of the HAD superfamily